MQTALTRKIAQFSRLLLYVILGLAALIFIVGILRGQPWPEMFMAAIALAVGAIPEGLPAVVTITLAIGVGWISGAAVPRCRARPKRVVGITLKDR